MFKFISLKTVLLCAATVPALSQACITANVATRRLDRNYSSITSLPVARYLNLDSSCDGRRLEKITLWASTSGGPGLATLIVNGRPVGASQQITVDLKSYEFFLDDHNMLGHEIGDMEIRLSGEFHVERIEARLSDLPDAPAPQDPWSTRGIGIGSTALVGPLLQSSVISIDPGVGRLEQIYFVAREGDFYVDHVVVTFADGSERRYGSALILKNEARRVQTGGYCPVKQIEIVGASDSDQVQAKIELRGLRQ